MVCHMVLPPSSRFYCSVIAIPICIVDIHLNLHSHDLRVPVGSLSRFKLSLPQCNVPGVLNCMSGRLSGFPSLYCRYLCISYESYKY